FFFCSFGTCPGTSSCRPCWPQTHRELPASSSGIKVPETMPNMGLYLTGYWLKEFPQQRYKSCWKGK
ncbi:hypothetical protein LEMLEM_LOCUS20001, partial [Lemmus lemmus]